jgi:large subunit ribosomal protein L16
MNFQKSKYRKVHKPRVSTVSFEQKRLAPVYGVYALKVAVTARISFARLDAARRTIKKIVKKNAYLWQTVFADQPVTSKPAEVRMGKGKGGFSHNVALVSAGSLIFELGGGGLTEKLARQAFLQASHKLGLPTRIVRYLV